MPEANYYVFENPTIEKTLEEGSSKAEKKVKGKSKKKRQRKRKGHRKRKKKKKGKAREKAKKKKKKSNLVKLNLIWLHMQKNNVV